MFSFEIWVATGSVETHLAHDDIVLRLPEVHFDRLIDCGTRADGLPLLELIFKNLLVYGRTWQKQFGFVLVLADIGAPRFVHFGTQNHHARVVIVEEVRLQWHKVLEGDSLARSDVDALLAVVHQVTVGLQLSRPSFWILGVHFVYD